MPPIVLLLALIAITAVAAFVSSLQHKSRSAKLALLATSWKMRYTAADRLQLTLRVASRFPIPGAADIVVRDLIYRQEDAGCFRYLFTVEYTTGVVRTKHRRVSVAMMVESNSNPFTQTDAFSCVTLAPGELALAERYDWLRQKYCAPPPAIESTIAS
jgi:hypothetical protein